MRNPSDLEQAPTSSEAENKEKDKIERMNRIRHALAGDTAENKELPKPQQKPQAQHLDVSVEDNPPPEQGSEATRAQKMAQIREALSMAEHSDTPAPAKASKGTLPPLKKKGSPGRAARQNAAAETVVTPRRPSGENQPPPVQQKTPSAKSARQPKKLKPLPQNQTQASAAPVQPQQAKSSLPPLKPLKRVSPQNKPETASVPQEAAAKKPEAAKNGAAATPDLPKPQKAAAEQPEKNTKLPPLRKVGTAPAVKTKAAAEQTKQAPQTIVKTAEKSEKKPAPEKKKKKKAAFTLPKIPVWKLCAIVGSSLAGVLILSYIITALTYINKFLPHTYINNIDVSGMTLEEAQDTLLASASVDDLVLITASNKEAAFAAKDYEAAYSLSDTALDEAFGENRLLWLGKLFKASQYEVKYDFSYSKETLTTLIKNYNWGNAPAENAKIVMNESGVYEIQPETAGDVFDTAILMNYVNEQLTDDVCTIQMAESGCYDKFAAEIRSEDLTDELEHCNKFAACMITFDFSDRKEVIYGEQIADWVKFDAEGSMVFDYQAIHTYVENMAAKYDTYGLDRTFRSTMDGTITVPWTGTSIYGWRINADDTTTQIIELIEAGQSVTVEPKYTYYGYCRDTNDIGNTYVEIDISAQHLWYYKNGAVVMESDCVTGTETARDRRTPRGIFQIWSHESPRVLGQMEEEGYEVLVNYWMPIDYTGVGLHDMNRSAFGGEIYMYNGSHGCINLPYNFVKELYNVTENGIPVIVHD